MKLLEYVDRLEKMLNRHDNVCGDTPRCPIRPYYSVEYLLPWWDDSDCRMCQEFVGLELKSSDAAGGRCPCYRTSSHQTARERARKVIARYRAERKQL